MTNYHQLRRAGFLAAMLHMGGTPLVAQEGGRDTLPIPESAARADRATFDPLLDAPARAGAPAVIFSAARGDGRVEAQAGLSAWSMHWVLKAEAPMTGGENDDTELLGLDGLQNGTTVALSVNGLIWGPERITVAQSEARPQWCREAQPVGRDGKPLDCDNYIESDIADPKLRAEYDRISRLYGPPPILYALEGEVGPNTFDFLDPSTFEAGSEDHWDWSLRAGAGVFVRPLTRLEASVGYERAWTPGRKQEVCMPTAASGALLCGDAILGTPSEAAGAVIRAGVRQFFRLNEFDVGLAPKLTYRTENQSLIIRAPIYFLPDRETGALTGGIAPVWNLDADRFGIILFVGPAFGLTDFPGRR